MMPAALKARAKRAGGVAAVVAASMAVGTSSLLAPQQSARAMAALDDDLENRITTMSTGDEQSILAEGESAQDRNEAIPLMNVRKQKLASYSAVPLGSQYYSAARRCLTQAIYYEAAREPELGMRAVAQVVLNRVRHPAYPNSVCGVVYQGVSAPVCQFSFTCDGSLLRTPLKELWNRADRYAAEALAGKQVSEVGTATHYHADYVVPRWAYTLGKIGKVGRHIFYRFPGSAGSSRSFYARWSGRESIPRIDFDRLRARLAADFGDAVEPAEEFTPGLTVTPHVTDRHAASDVGGRLDTTTTWRLTIPDPTRLSASYRDKLAEQGDGSGGIAASGSEPVAALAEAGQ